MVVWRSSDGVDWTPSAKAKPGLHFAADVAAASPDGTVLVATRDQGRKGYASWLYRLDADGTWSEQPAPMTNAKDSATVRSIVPTSEGWLLALATLKGKRECGGIAASTDGVDWQPVLETRGYLADIVATPNGYVALARLTGLADEWLMPSPDRAESRPCLRSVRARESDLVRTCASRSGQPATTPHAQYPPPRSGNLSGRR